jgi:hypothetical protein
MNEELKLNRENDDTIQTDVQRTNEEKYIDGISRKRD